MEEEHTHIFESLIMKGAGESEKRKKKEVPSLTTRTHVLLQKAKMIKRAEIRQKQKGFFLQLKIERLAST